MIRVAGRDFREVSLVDFEFCGAPGELVRPVCLVVHEIGSGVTRRLWADEFAHLPAALDGLRIAQLSDQLYGSSTSS